MIWTIGSIVYGLIGLVTARLVAGHFAWDSLYTWQTKPDGEDWFMGYMAGIPAGIFWPMLVIGLNWHRVPQFPVVVGEERKGREKLKQAAAEQQRLAFERMEIELGITESAKPEMVTYQGNVLPVPLPYRRDEHGNMMPDSWGH